MRATGRPPVGPSQRIAGAWARVPALLLLAVTALPVSAFRIRTATQNGVRYVLLEDVARYYGLALRSGKADIRLKSRYSDIRFVVERRAARVNSVPVDLSYAPRRWKKAPLLSETDFRLLLDPILRGHALPRSTVRTIALDPGHGGKDTGAVGQNGIMEKDLVLQVALRLATRLRKAGFRVLLTRSSDKTVELGSRPALARTGKADLLVSLHMNSAKSRSVRGVETFFLTPAGTSSTYSRRHSKRKGSGNGFDRCNTRLAYEIQKNLVRVTGCEDRGIKHARFLVLRNAPCPAVLVEMGFVSNSRELKKLRTATYRERLAAGICYGIRAYAQCVAPTAK
ncbi:MAG: N-acetylmuramoyl-L-alanine amidase [Kiritimatiellaeota bacterium]|nr:N-acetylmuramoyl-L-alanine amidase [Kiritimatiellota bacterium]